MDIVGAFTGLTAARDVLSSAIKARDEALIRSATDNLSQRVIDVTSICIQLQQDRSTAIDAERLLKDRVRELESEIAELRAQATDRARYELDEPYPGTFAYRLKTASDIEEPVHHLCQGCMDNEAKKSILQIDPKNYTVRLCPRCNAKHQFEELSYGV